MPYISVGPIILTPEQKSRITEELQKRKALRPCARCGHGEFGVLDTVFANPPHNATDVQVYETPFSPKAPASPFYPTIGVFCINCGAVYHHVLGILVPLQEFGIGK